MKKNELENAGFIFVYHENHVSQDKILTIELILHIKEDVVRTKNIETFIERTYSFIVQEDEDIVFPNIASVECFNLDSHTQKYRVQNILTKHKKECLDENEKRRDALRESLQQMDKIELLHKQVSEKIPGLIDPLM